MNYNQRLVTAQPVPQTRAIQIAVFPGKAFAILKIVADGRIKYNSHSS